MKIERKHVKFHFTKILDIGFIGIIDFIYCFIVGRFLDRVSVKMFGTDNKKKSTFVIYMEVAITVIFIAILSYIGRNLCEKIPSPFQSSTFDHSRVVELRLGIFFPVYMTMFQYQLQEKLDVLKKRYQDK